MDLSALDISVIEPIEHIDSSIEVKDEAIVSLINDEPLNGDLEFEPDDDLIAEDSFDEFRLVPTRYKREDFEVGKLVRFADLSKTSWK